MKRPLALCHLVMLATVWAGSFPIAAIADTTTESSSGAGSAVAAPAPIKPISVYVLGAVATPGIVHLANEPGKKPRLLDAIRAAGGVQPEGTAKSTENAKSETPITTDSAEATQLHLTDVRGATARLLREGGTRTIELFGLRDSNVTSNTSLREGDVVVVARAETEMAMAAGAVLRPGKHALRPRTSAAAFLKAAGFAPNAALQEAYIQRGSERIAVDGEALLDGRAQGPVLKAGDILQVPAGKGLVEVRGAIRFPGVRTFRPSMTILDAVGLCGGWGNLADINAMPQVMAQASFSAPLQNNIAVSGQSRELPFTLQGLFQTANFKNSAALAPGQHLVIPERDRVTIIGAKRSPHYAAARLSLKEALRAAGGTTQNADLTHIVIMGGAGRPQGVVVDIEATEKLLPGDVIWIAPKNSVAVCGAVVRPQAVGIESNSTLLDSIKAAGGLTPLAATDAVAILRPQDGRLNFLKSDLAKALSGDAAGNPAVQIGDIVVVPFREKLNEKAATRPAVTLTPLLSFLVGAPGR